VNGVVAKESIGTLQNDFLVLADIWTLGEKNCYSHGLGP
jgi:hypothetical protein